MDWSAIAKLAGSAVSAYSKSKTDNRTAKTADLYNRDRLTQDAQRNFENAQEQRAIIDVNQHKVASDNQGDAWKRSLQASLAKHFKPAVRPRGVANISFVGDHGGPEQQAAADAMQRVAMERLLGGEDFAPIGALAPQQKLSDIPQASTWEKISALLGTGLSVAGAIAKIKSDEKGESDGSGGMSSSQQNPSIWQNIRF